MLPTKLTFWLKTFEANLLIALPTEFRANLIVLIELCSANEQRSFHEQNHQESVGIHQMSKRTPKNFYNLNF